MSVNQQDLDPDSTTDVEDVADAEEELIKKCEEMWKDMEEVTICDPMNLLGSSVHEIFQTRILDLEIHQWFSATGRRRQWHPTPVLLPGKSHGQRRLVGCSP
ncbi:hypothetical protein FD755_018655 [Muntiacus reevesi]|uniref:Uncharacterized protein n=1 Tax=Muntiacus reevesi TaxID=9886 RepID=A0A5N3X761_MUNRE|nr:hypothetical protein FD755_018655 [Muntiacus reevesi]